MVEAVAGVGVSPYLDEAGQALRQRHIDWWERKGSLFVETHGGPLGDLWLPLSDGTLATEDVDLTPDMLDVERLVGPALEPGPLDMGGDTFASQAPYTRVPWVEAILGCPIRATIKGGSMRTQSFIRDWDEWESMGTHRHQGWFDVLKEITRLLGERANGRHAVVQTLMRGPSDLAEAVLGPEMMALSMYDSPIALKRFVEEVTEAFIEILEAQLARMPKIEGGYVNPWGIWAPGTVVRTQCDASAILSPQQYKEWYLPYDERISETVGYSTIHLHSCSLHTVDALLEAEKPMAIQVTRETAPPSVPTIRELVPIFRRILETKRLIADGPMTDEEVSILQNELPADGIYIGQRRSSW